MNDTPTFISIDFFIDPPFCSGTHLCLICDNKYKCEGLAISHSTNTNGGRCQGKYEQYCPNHTIREYDRKDLELGDLS
jgi:hypothetical protein